jgi:hypothetical protein
VGKKVYSLSIPKSNIYNSSPTIQASTTVNPIVNSPVQNPMQTSFKGETVISKPPLTLRTTLSTKDEQKKYLQIAANLDTNSKKNLELLLKSGILLNNNSNDKSSTLDNLYKMATTPRKQGLSSQTVLRETVNAITDPFIITQNFGDIPSTYKTQIIQQSKPNSQNPKDKITGETIGVEHSSDCVSASIEFNLAKQMPAEFARFAEGLTSPRMSVDKKIQLKNLTDNTLDSIYLLDTFKVPYKMNNFDSAKLTLAPDKNAFIRAQIQNSDKDELERSVVDVLMQSTFMNVGSQNTYDSLTDLRGGDFSTDEKGLIEFEKTFTESIIEDKNKISVTYQNLDENAKLIGYNKDFNTIQKNILDSLTMGENVIIGYTQTDKDKKVINGHEITILGALKDKKGNLIFICNDTDDNNPNPIAYPASYLIPKIHHAGLPQKIGAEGTPTEESWREGVKSYKEVKQKIVKS